MEIIVTDSAQDFVKNEMLVEAGAAVRFISRVYGKTQVHEGFSVGVNVVEPDEVLAGYEANGILYYIDKADEWFFNGYDFEVDYDEPDEAFIFNFNTEK